MIGPLTKTRRRTKTGSRPHRSVCGGHCVAVDVEPELSLEVYPGGPVSVTVAVVSLAVLWPAVLWLAVLWPAVLWLAVLAKVELEVFLWWLVPCD